MGQKQIKAGFKQEHLQEVVDKYIQAYKIFYNGGVSICEAVNEMQQITNLIDGPGGLREIFPEQTCSLAGTRILRPYEEIRVRLITDPEVRRGYMNAQKKCCSPSPNMLSSDEEKCILTNKNNMSSPSNLSGGRRRRTKSHRRSRRSHSRSHRVRGGDIEGGRRKRRSHRRSRRSASRRSRSHRVRGGCGDYDDLDGGRRRSRRSHRSRKSRRSRRSHLSGGRRSRRSSSSRRPNRYAQFVKHNIHKVGGATHQQKMRNVAKLWRSQH